MAENIMLVQQGFRILHPLMAGYIAQELSREYKSSWWQDVLMVLDDQSRDLPESGDYATLVDSLDIANCLRIIDRKWNDVFRKKLSLDYRTWSKELMGVRNKLAHIGGNDFSDDDTWRALDTMARLCEAFDDDGAEEIRSILRESRYGSSAGSTHVTENAIVPEPKQTKAVGVLSKQTGGLPSWRDVIEPHPDVAQGRYKNAEFAADLAQVARGEGAFEYRDPVEFFARTYVTVGMSSLLVQAMKRVTGKDGDSVIQLKTAFGGGKTHSMLALYHMMRGRVTIDKIPVVKPVLDEAGVTSLPRANVAVLVGTALDPSKPKRPQNMPGITINTIWGEMAAQLAQSAGDLSLYDYVKEADKKGVSPGSEAIKNLFDAAAPCLVLMDELVAYAKKLYMVDGLPAGSYDNFITFIQEVTEAARASKNSLVVASIPESDIEIGGDSGKIALAAIEHTFGRMEAIWKPVASDEGFEVVRRRLFLPCKDTAARDMVCQAFSQMYNENPNDFPVEAKSVSYRDRMISCYPIHPEVFDRLYNDWSTLERFQRTRGVLRLMAAVIHELWMGNDGSAMIMPGSLPLDVSNVSYELTRHLHDDAWNAIVDSEVDGKKSVPYQKDKGNTRFGNSMAARRVTRTIFLGSAPTSRSQSVKGIEASRVRLGTVQPGENIATFNDALSTLQNSLAYLYTNPSNDRFWYDTRPTLRKMVEDRATQVSQNDVEYELETRLKKIRREAPFAGVHVCPSSSLDVPDEKSVRLVILRPSDGYRASSPDKTRAMAAIQDIFENRGTSPRNYRNMLAFIAPDQERVHALEQETRRYIAWKSVKDDSETLNLDATQNKETQNSLNRCNNDVDVKIKEAYSWLIVPYIDRSVDIREVSWNVSKINGGTESIVSKAASQMAQNEELITRWAPQLLKMELDSLLWKDSDSIVIKNLWDCLCKYCYLPRLASYEVLENAIKAGVDSEDFFSLASGKDAEKFLNLRYNQSVSEVNEADLVVKNDAARKQLLAKKDEVPVQPVVQPGTGWGMPSTPTSGGTSVPDAGGWSPVGGAPITPAEKLNTRFYMSADLDNTRLYKNVQTLYNEIISQLAEIDGCKISLSLEVSAQNGDGFSPDIIRAVSENCRTMNVKDFGFEE